MSIRLSRRTQWHGDVARMIASLGMLMWCRPGIAAELTVCQAGCAFTTIQAAVDAAAGGDIIRLRAGSTYRENVVLRLKNISTYIEMTTDAPVSQLPGAS